MTAWYTHSGVPQPHNWARSKDMREEFSAIAKAFAKLETLEGKAGNVAQYSEDSNNVVFHNAEDAGIVGRILNGKGVSNSRSDAGVGTVSLTLSTLDEGTSISSANVLGFYNGSVSKKITLANLRTSLNLPNIATGTGLDGSGNSGTVTIDWDDGEHGIVTSISSAHTIPFHDVSESGMKKVTFANFKTSLVLPKGGSNIDDLTASTGLTAGGGSNVAAGSAEIDLKLSALSALTAIATTDTIPFYDNSASGNKKITRTNFSSQIGASNLTFTSAHFDETKDSTAYTSTVDVTIDDLTDISTAASGDFIVVKNSSGIRKAKISTVKTSLSLVTGLTGVAGSNGIAGTTTSQVSTLDVDINSLTTSATAISDDDLIAFHDTTSPGETKKIKFSDFETELSLTSWTAGTGISIDASDNLAVDFDDLTAASIVGTDSLLFADTSADGNKSRLITLNNFKSDLNISSSLNSHVNPTFSDGLDKTSTLAIDLDVNGMTSSTDTWGDSDYTLAILDDDDTTKKVKLATLKSTINYPTRTASSGLSISSDNLNVNLSGLTTVTDLDGTDYAIVITGNNSRKITLANLLTSIQSDIAKAPGTPVVSISAGGNEIVVSWTTDNNASPITNIEVQYRTAAVGNTPAGSWTDIDHTATGTSTIIDRLSAVTKYDVRVRHTNAKGTSGYGTKSVTTTAVGPHTPALTITRGNTQLSLSWSLPTSDGGSALSGYDIDYRKKGAESWTNVAHTGLTRTKTITGLTNGVTYEVRVRAKNEANKTSAYDTEEATPANNPSAPTLSTSTDDGSITVTYNAPDNGGSSITGYNIRYRIKVTSGTPNEWINTLVNKLVTSHTISGLTNETIYEIQSQSINIIGNSLWGTIVEAMPQRVPPIPTNLSVSNITTVSATLNYTRTYDTDGVIIRYKSDHNSVKKWKEVSDNSVNSPSLTSSISIAGLHKGQPYVWQIKSNNEKGTSNWSDEQRFNASSTVPDPPTVLTVTPGNGTIKLKFQAGNSNGTTQTKWEIFYRATTTDNSVNPWISIAAQTADKRKYNNITGLTNGQQYEVRVRGWNSHGWSALGNSLYAIPYTKPTINSFTAALNDSTFHHGKKENDGILIRVNYTSGGWSDDDLTAKARWTNLDSHQWTYSNYFDVDLIGTAAQGRGFIIPALSSDNDSDTGIRSGRTKQIQISLGHENSNYNAGYSSYSSSQIVTTGKDLAIKNGTLTASSSGANNITVSFDVLPFQTRFTTANESDIISKDQITLQIKKTSQPSSSFSEVNVNTSMLSFVDSGVGIARKTAVTINNAILTSSLENNVSYTIRVFAFNGWISDTSTIEKVLRST